MTTRRYIEIHGETPPDGYRIFGYSADGSLWAKRIDIEATEYHDDDLDDEDDEDMDDQPEVAAAPKPEPKPPSTFKRAAVRLKRIFGVEEAT